MLSEAEQLKKTEERFMELLLFVGRWRVTVGGVVSGDAVYPVKSGTWKVTRFVESLQFM